MTHAEFEAWIEFYRRWPFGEQYRFQSKGADALSAAFGVPVR